jgi:hypothetical protein
MKKEKPKTFKLKKDLARAKAKYKYLSEFYKQAKNDQKNFCFYYYIYDKRGERFFSSRLITNFLKPGTFYVCGHGCFNSLEVKHCFGNKKMEYTYLDALKLLSWAMVLNPDGEWIMTRSESEKFDTEHLAIKKY